MEVRNDKGELVAGDHGKPKLVTEVSFFPFLISSTCRTMLRRDATSNEIDHLLTCIASLLKNFVFQKKVSEGKDAPWIAVRSIPTLSPLQAVGEKDERLLKVTNREKKTAITVVA